MPINLSGNTISSSDVDSLNYSSLTTKVNKSGLILHLDADDKNSFIGGGSTWYDLSGNGANMTIYGSPAWNPLSGFTINADGKYFQGSITNFPTDSLTLEAWIKLGQSEVVSYPTGDMGTIIYATGGNDAYLSYDKSNLKPAAYWYGHPTEGYHESTAAMQRSPWYHVANIWDNNKKAVYQWLNGTLTSVLNVTGYSVSNTTINICRQTANRQFSGNIVIVRIYNRNLQPYEIAENYVAQKGRFGY